MTDNLLYHEKLTSAKTEALFVALTLLFLSLTLWRVDSRGWDGLAITLAVFCAIFIFYSLNYRTLVIRLTYETLKLTFGLFTWTVPLDNIEGCQLDELPAIMKYGGAGIHFMMIRNRYRASFNFLEYPRVVIAFKKKVGLARDISFSTRKPEEVIRLIRKAMEENARKKFQQAMAKVADVEPPDFDRL